MAGFDERGIAARWRRDGKELFYVAPDGMLISAPISVPTTGTSIEVEPPELLFATRITGGQAVCCDAVAADGKRFLLNAVSKMNIRPGCT